MVFTTQIDNGWYEMQNGILRPSLIDGTEKERYFG